MKKTLLVLLVLCATGFVFAQTPFTATYTFGADGNVQSFGYNGTNYPAITMSNIDKVGVTTSSSSNNFRATGWPTSASPDAGKYIGFIMTAAAGYKFTVTTINFGIGRSGTGTRDTEWRGSADSYAALINNYTTLNSNLTNNSGVLNNTDANSNWSGNVLTLGTGYADVATSCGFRIYLYSAEAGTGTAGLAGPLTISGTFESTAAVPSLTVDPTTLSGFTYVFGNGPSQELSFALSGTNLTANVDVTSAGTNYEIASISGGPFGTTLSFTPAAGSVSATVYVQLIADLAIGSYNGETITCSSSGATSQTVSCSGTVSPPPPPEAPLATVANAVSENGFTATWDAVSGTTGYEIDVYYLTEGTNATDLIISEYVEGSASNKYIEIYNGTGNPVDLSNYYLQLYSNGAATPGSDINLSGTLAHGGTVVYKNDLAALTLPIGVTAITNAAVNFNGDDAVALYYNDGTNAHYVDIFGVIDQDPGTQWTADGGFQTVDRTLVRKATVTSGVNVNPTNTGDNITTDFVTLGTEWDLYSVDTASNLGSHTMAGGSTLVYVTGYQDYNAGNVTSLTITGLDPSTTYYYVVRAYNAYGTSGNSNEIAVTTEDEPLPVVLSSFTATMTNDLNVQLTWITQSEDNMNGFYVRRATVNELGQTQLVSPLIQATNTSTLQTYTFVDREDLMDGTYYYWLEEVEMDGAVDYFGPITLAYSTNSTTPPVIPAVTTLKAVYPNPFNPNAVIPYTLAESRDVTIHIYNTRGQIIRSFYQGTQPANSYQIAWDGTDTNGNALGTGVYHIRLLAGKDSFQRKAVLIK